MYLSVDGTGTLMCREEVEGVAGKREEGSAGTRGVRLAVVHSAEGRDQETGAVIKDRGSETFSCLTGSAAALSGGRGTGRRLRRGRMDTERLRRAVRAPAEVPGYPLVGEGRQHHVGTERLRHEPQAGRPA